MSVKDGRIYLPHGQFYEVLVLPEEKQINPDVLRKIEQMVKEGATIVGPKPEEAYSLAKAGAQDAAVKEIGGRLWGDTGNINIRENNFGKGRVVWGKPVRDVLYEKSVYPDFSTTESSEAGTLDYIHRSASGMEIYFIRNKTSEDINSICRFRVQNKAPEYWDPQTGEIMPVNVYRPVETGTELPLSFGPYGSCFIIFREQPGRTGLAELPAGEIAYTRSGGVLLTPDPVLSIEGPWEVRFHHRSGTPVTTTFNKLISWDKSENPSIRYFSGIASYRTIFNLPEALLHSNHALFFELNKVTEIAGVYLNGKKLGLHWDPSCRFNIAGLVKPGKNYLEIEVVNSINNMLVGDAQKPEEFRQTRSNISKLPNAWMSPFAEAPLKEAGLFGPVLIFEAKPLNSQKQF